ncbi:MAG: ADP-ribosylglycohydrolase family protein [FCB group bacterium]|nr:ADP-ribosylglycohydrolase family protein [FCB group bacterium]
MRSVYKHWAIYAKNLFLLAILFTFCGSLMASDFTFGNRVSGLLHASAVTDAMAGPYEGRSTEKSQNFLDDGGWIDGFTKYSRWFQHYWNVYEYNAAPGTYTDDNRLRLFVANAMIESYEQYKKPMDRIFLAQQVFEAYRSASKIFSETYLKTAHRSDSPVLDRPDVKIAFLHQWFTWEIAKTATSVFIPEDPSIFSPGFIYTKELDDNGVHNGEWSLKQVEAFKVTEDIKPSYNDNCYARGEEMPLGQIALLPLSIYFPGDPVAAFHYTMDLKFMDIGNAPLYPAVMNAMLADLLGGTEWSSIAAAIKSGLPGYVNYTGPLDIQKVQHEISSALKISGSFKSGKTSYTRENYSAFIKALHKEFAQGEVMMCHVEEMLCAVVALVDFAPPDINEAMLMAVNYGRDNDTIASMAGCFLGAIHGSEKIKAEWKQTVQDVNPRYNISEIAAKLTEIHKNR